MSETKTGKQLYHHVPDYVVYDLETTGVSSRKDEIIEISALKVRGGIVVDSFSSLVKPPKCIPERVSLITNIFDDMVKDAPLISEVLPSFIEFIGDDILVGHNISSFDMKFICRDCEKHLDMAVANDYVDTLWLAKMVFPDWPHRRLSDIAEYYNISTKGAHRALSDCIMNQQIFELMAKEETYVTNVLERNQKQDEQ